MSKVMAAAMGEIIMLNLAKSESIGMMTVPQPPGTAPAAARRSQVKRKQAGLYVTVARAISL